MKRLLLSIRSEYKEKDATCTTLNSVLLAKRLLSVPPAEKASIVFAVSAAFDLYRKSQFKIWCMRRNAAVQTLLSGTSDSDSIILLATLTAAPCAQE